MSSSVAKPQLFRQNAAAIPSRLAGAHCQFRVRGAKELKLAPEVSPKAAVRLALALQHKRLADFRTAALCAEGTWSVVNMLAIVASRRGRRIT